jgi:anionic cell wall polymer biosynthesis LytR-Cps2A-Psr (LCP) family protein
VLTANSAGQFSYPYREILILLITAIFARSIWSISSRGPEAACREVERLLNVDVDHYVLTNFQGFEKWWIFWAG